MSLNWNTALLDEEELSKINTIEGLDITISDLGKRNLELTNYCRGLKLPDINLLNAIIDNIWYISDKVWDIIENININNASPVETFVFWESFIQFTKWKFLMILNCSGGVVYSNDKFLN